MLPPPCFFLFERLIKSWGGRCDKRMLPVTVTEGAYVLKEKFCLKLLTANRQSLC